MTIYASEEATLTPRGVRISDEKRAEFGRRMAELRTTVVDDLGQSDVDAMRQTIQLHRRLDLTGRVLLEVAWFPPAFVAGTAALTVAKILDNMEIGHNIMHGQYDWTGDPALRGRDFEWDTPACLTTGAAATTSSTTPGRTSSTRTETSATGSCGWTRTAAGRPGTC